VKVVASGADEFRRRHRVGGMNAYEHNGVRVGRFGFASESKELLRELYRAGDPEARTAFARMLDEESPNVVHFHAFIGRSPSYS
jgi:predicted protein tyrosine phosphatase